MFAMLKEGVYPLTDVPKMVMMSIRSFHVYLADSFTTAAKRAPKRDVIETYIKVSFYDRFILMFLPVISKAFSFFKSRHWDLCCHNIKLTFWF